MKRLQYVAVVLLGIVMLLFAFKQVEFFMKSEAGIFLIKIWIPVALLLTAVFLGKLVGLKGWWGISILIATEFFFLICFELAAHRVKLPSGLLDFLRTMYMDKCRNIGQYHPECGQYHRKLFYTLKPGRCQFFNIEFETELRVNSVGFRDDEQSLEQPAVVFLGDSFTMGWGVGQNETYCELLEKKLNRRCLNLGMSSFGTAREVAAANEFDLKKTQLLFLQYGVSDEIENEQYIKNGFLLPISPAQRFVREQRWNSIWKQWFPLKYTYVGLFNIAEWTIKWLKNQPLTQPVKKVLTIQELSDFFVVLSKLQEKFKGNIVLFNFCQWGQANSISHQFETWLKVHPMEKVSVLHLGNYLGEEDFYFLDDHLNASGHAKVANLLEKHIYDNKLIISQ